MTVTRAYLGMQCFWGESAFAKLDGVLKTRVGYAGGKVPDPTYKAIKDHTEVTEITFDDAVLSYKSLLDFFFAHHDPQVPRKAQYQSLILYTDPEQKSEAETTLNVVKKTKPNAETRVEPLDRFYQAEDYHQKYWLRCQKSVFDSLKLSDEQVADSNLATKLNAFLAGYQRFDVLEALAKENKLGEALVDKVRKIAEAGGDPRSCH